MKSVQTSQKTMPKITKGSDIKISQKILKQLKLQHDGLEKVPGKKYNADLIRKVIDNGLEKTSRTFVLKFRGHSRDKSYFESTKSDCHLIVTVTLKKYKKRVKQVTITRRIICAS